MQKQVSEPHVLDLLQSKGFLFSSHKSGHINVFEVPKQNLLTKKIQQGPPSYVLNLELQ